MAAICMCCEAQFVAKLMLHSWNFPRKTKLGFVPIRRRATAATFRASAIDSPESSSNFAKRMDQAWIISQQPRPVGCSSCNSKGHVECKWCAEMDAKFIYPLESCKIIHLLRHGQAVHNVEAEKDRNLLLSPHLFDASLTNYGHQQVKNLRERVVSSGLLNRVELVVTSPLSRTMQTAVGVFGSEDKQLNMISNPPILALEVVRDRNGVRPPDMRRNVSEYQKLFPTIDFSQMESEEDILWRPDVRESEKEILSRGLEFMKWLWKRPEKEVAIVSHGIVLQHMLYVFANDYDESVRTQLCKRFGNCEIRTVVIVDKGLSCSTEN